MKRTKYNYSVIALITALILIVTVRCTKDFEGLEPATYPQTAEVFIDGFSAGLAYEAWGDVTAFDVDKEVVYKGTSSMKFAVPDQGQTGGYAGGRFSTSMARDLSDYDALTFWAKATQAAALDVIGFGNNAQGSEYQTTLTGVKVNSNWKKYTIPIPDPSKLTSESGLFYYSESPEEGSGYTFWIDEVKFEKLGTIAHPEPAILNGEDKVAKTFINTTIVIDGFSYTANLPNGVNQSAEIGPAYFTFSSSDTTVAKVDESGVVSIINAGTALITASLNDVEATGSLTVESSGSFVHAPIPTVDSADVISIFSNAYANVPVDFYNGYWEPYQTTQSADFQIDGDDVLNYYNFNFVGIQFASPTIDAGNMTHLHMDIFVPNEVNAQDQLLAKLVDYGADGSSDEPNPSISITLASPTLVSQEWIGVDMDLSGLASKGNLAQIVFENLGSPLSGFYVDNIYLYNDGGGTGGNEPEEAAPTPQERDAADVISIYSDAYTNLEGTDYPDWGQTTVVSDVDIAGNSTLKLANLNYQGIQLASSQDVSGMEYLHIDYWTANSSALNTFLISSGPVEKAHALAVPTTGWMSVDIPLSDFSPVDLADIIQFKFDGNGDIYMDNIYFYKSGGGTGIEPTEAAPTPTQDDANVVSVYSDEYTDIAGTDFNPDWGQSTAYSEVAVAGNNTMLYTSFDYQGIDFSSNKFDATTMTHFHMDIWTPNDVLDKVFTIKCVDFGGGAAEASNFILTITHTANGNIPALATGSWISIDVPISDFSGDLTKTDLAQIVTSGSLSDVYIDNVYFYKGDGGTGSTPTEAAPTPTQDAADVVSVYSDEYTDISGTDFNPGWGQTTVYSEVPIAGNNTMLYTNFDYQGIDFSTNKFDASEMTNFHMDIWTPNEVLDKVFTIKIVDFGGGNAEASNFILTVTHTDNGNIPALQTGSWVSIDVPISDFTGDLTKTDLAQIVTSGSLSDVYLDNVYFYKTGGTATEPAEAAPTPTVEADSVISLFSDAYTNIDGTNFDPDWGQSTDATTIDIDGNSTLKYATFNYQGTVLGSAQDVSGMDYLHIDMWTADATDVKVTPINASGSPTENLVALTPISAGQWNSYDIPLSEFTNSGMTVNEIIQLKFDGQGGVSPSNIWLDNIYFYKNGGGGTTECTGETVQSLSASDFNLTFMSDPTASIIEDGGDFEWIDNPDFDNAVNSSCKVGKITKLGNNAWDNNQIDLDAKLDFNSNTGLKIKVWSSRANTEVRIKLEEIGNAGNNTEQFITTTVTSGWEELTFPFTSDDSDKFNKIVIFFDLNANNTDTYYFDDLMLYGTGGGGGGGDCTPPEGDFISNGGFETGNTDCWLFFDNGGTTEVTNTENNGGTYSAKITTAPQKNPGIKAERFGVGTISPNQKLEVKLDSKVESLVDGAVVNVLAFSESSTEGVAAVLHHLGTINVTPGSWNANTVEFTTAGDVSGGVSLLLEVVCGGAASCSGVVYFDNVSVKVAN